MGFPGGQANADGWDYGQGTVAGRGTVTDAVAVENDAYGTRMIRCRKRAHRNPHYRECDSGKKSRWKFRRHVGACDSYGLGDPVFRNSSSSSSHMTVGGSKGRWCHTMEKRVPGSVAEVVQEGVHSSVGKEADSNAVHLHRWDMQGGCYLVEGRH